MSLSARAVLLVLTVLLLALSGSLLIHTWSAREALQIQLELRNRDAAAALALALSQQKGDAAALKTVAQAHFDLGAYAWVQLKRLDGQPTIELARPDPQPNVPAWFVQVLPVQALPGKALVSDGWKELGHLEVQAQSAWAYAALWQAFSRTAGLLALLGLVAASLSVLALRAWRRPLRATVAQAQALEQGRFVQASEPRLPELRDLTRSMNAMVTRLRQVLTQQAEQVAALQRSAQLDAVTGLPQREHFMARLARLRPESPAKGANEPTQTVPKPLFGEETSARVLDDPTAPLGSAAVCAGLGPATALVLMRVQDLDLINARLGRHATDRLLAAVAQVLTPYVERVDGSFAGRLNGSDFALCLPVAGVASETAASLHAALAAAPLLNSASASVAVGAVEVSPNMGGSAALAAADDALARAEYGSGWFSPQHTGDAAGGSSALPSPAGAGAGAGAVAADTAVAGAQRGPLAAATGTARAARAGRVLTGGSQVWRHQIAQALAENRAQLAEYVVVDAAGQMLTLQCPLRVQLVVGQEYQAAARWLALARRSRLMPQVDLKALELALERINIDQQARCVHVSWPSLSAPGFAPEVLRRLQKVPTAACRLSIEFVHSARPANWLNVASVMQNWRELGVKVGTEHSSAQPQLLVDLQALGVDYVKVDPRHLQGLSSDEAVKTYVQALVRLVHGLNAKAWAAGVMDDAELSSLWRYGFDAATGPAVTRAYQLNKVKAG